MVAHTINHKLLNFYIELACLIHIENGVETIISWSYYLSSFRTVILPDNSVIELEI